MESELNEGFELFSKGNCTAALKLLEAVLQHRRSIFGPDKPETLEVQYIVAGVYHKQGKYEDALNRYKDVYKRRVNTLGHDHPDTWTAWSSCASMLFQLGRLDEALSIFEDIYAKREGLLGPCHEDTLLARNNVALVRSSQGENVLPVLEDIYNIKKKADPEASSTLSSRFNIAAEFDKQGKYPEALEILNEVHSLQKEKEFVEESWKTQEFIGHIAFKQGKYDEAKKIYEKVYNGFATCLGKDHPHTVDAYHNVGTVFIKQGSYSDGLNVLREVHTKRKLVLGEDNPQTLLTQSNIAEAYVLLGKLDIALTMYKNVHEIEKQLYPNYMYSLATLKSIGRILFQQDKHDEALDIFNTISEIQSDHHPESPEVLENERFIAKLHFNKGNHAKAWLMFCGLEKTHVEVYGPEHSLTLEVLINLAASAQKQGNYIRALEALSQVLDVQNKSDDRSSDSAIEIQNDMGSIYLRLGRYSEAKDTFDEVHFKLLSKLGNDHPSVLAARKKTGHALECQEKYESALEIYREVYNGMCKALGKNHSDTVETEQKIEEIMTIMTCPDAS